MLGAISLDLFAVLLGGATALMPVFARDILDVGPWGLGLLRSAPGIGAVVMGIWLVRNPIRDHAGRIMFAAVAVFGVCHRRLRAFQGRLALGDCAHHHGRRRHGQRLRPRHPRPALDAGRGARTRVAR